MRQYFYLVTYKYDECTIPRKVFLQEYEAIKWGRKETTKKLQETQDTNYEYILYRQEITRTGELQYIKTLKPYPTKELVDAGLINTEAGGD
jgi:hypothetical protein